MRATSRYRFGARSIRARWTVARADVRRRSERRGKSQPARPYRVQLSFPTSGVGATVAAVRRDGRRVVLSAGGRSLRLSGVRAFDLQSASGGYRVGLAAGTRGRAGVHAAARQRANPRGGPTLELELPPLRRRSVDVRVTLVPL